MDKFTFIMRGHDGLTIAFEQTFEGATVEELVNMFKNFLLANEYAEASINKYIDEYGEINYEEESE